MIEKIEKSLQRDREKLKAIEEKITMLNLEYMNLLDTNKHNIHLGRITGEVNYLEHQQELLVKNIRLKKEQLNSYKLDA